MDVAPCLTAVTRPVPFTSSQACRLPAIVRIIRRSWRKSVGRYAVIRVIQHFLHSSHVL
jgi:hypothetical protein